jgi:uncharacterized membrane-anchored protein
MKVPDYRTVVGDLDWRAFPTRLLFVGLLPFLACLIILVSEPGIEPKLLHQSIIVAVALWVVGGALYARMQYVEERRAGERPSTMGSLLQVAMTLLAVVVLLSVTTRLH